MSFKYLSIPLAAGLCSLAFAAAQVQAGSVTDALARCGTSSKSATVHCCETVLRKNKKPYWMGDKTCAQVVSCSGGGGGALLAQVAPVGAAVTKAKGKGKKHLCAVYYPKDTMPGKELKPMKQTGRM